MISFAFNLVSFSKKKRLKSVERSELKRYASPILSELRWKREKNKDRERIVKLSIILERKLRNVFWIPIKKERK